MPVETAWLETARIRIAGGGDGDPDRHHRRGAGMAPDSARARRRCGGHRPRQRGERRALQAGPPAGDVSPVIAILAPEPTLLAIVIVGVVM